MDFSRFFIDRPIFAAVLSILIFVAGAIAIPLLPISEYPDVVPPSVQVRAEYPGANPKEIAETVATPLEEAINGVENMMYMKSVAGSDGVLVTTVTFRPGTDPDQAQVQVQNRVAQAEARLPEDVRRQGITTQKQSPALTLVVHLVSPSGKYDSLYLRNYATLKVKDELARLPGVGQVQIFGAGEYAMRIWLDPNKVAARGLTASDVVSAMQEQNVQVSAGQLGAEPMPTRSDYLLSINAQGRLQTEEEFGNIILKSGDNGEIVRLRDVARIEMGSGSYALRAQLNNKDAVGIGIFQSPGANAIELSDAVRGKMAELATRFPDGMSWKAPYDPTVFVRDSIRAVVDTLLEAVILVVLVVILFLQTWRASIIPLLAVPISVVGTFAALYLLGFSLNTLSLFGLVLAIGIVVDDAIVVVENVERNIEEGLSPLAAAHQAMREVSGPIIAIAVVLLKEHAWKVCIRESVSRVRIPPSPPYSTKKPELTFRLFCLHSAPAGRVRILDRVRQNACVLDRQRRPAANLSLPHRHILTRKPERKFRLFCMHNAPTGRVRTLDRVRQNACVLDRQRQPAG